ncbi:MAG: DUF3347 domain-containing protein [Myxococcota bacterium]
MMNTKLTVIFAIASLLIVGSLTGCENKKEEAASAESASSKPTQAGEATDDNGESEADEAAQHMDMEGMGHGGTKADSEPVHANFMHDEMIILDERADAPQDFRSGLGHMHDHYMAMSEAMVSDDSKAASAAAEKMHEQMGKLDGSALEGEAQKAWKTHQKVMSDSLGHMMEADDMKTMREQFSHMSEGIYGALHSFGGTDHPVHVAHCPMAMDGDGAYWLSTDKEISNPYMGAEMPGCGEFMATIE